MRPHPLSAVKKLSVFLVFYLIAAMARAQVYNSAVSSATGGTGRASVEPGDAMFLNPSILAHLKGRYLYGSFTEKGMALTLTDNTPESVLPAGLGYLQKTTDVPQGELTQHDILLTLSEFVVDKWAFGITGHYLEQKLPTKSYRQTNADLGIMFTPKSHIGWGVVVYNVFGGNTEIPEDFRTKTSVAGGFNYIYKGIARFRLDASSESLYMAGMESFLNRFVVVRFGYSVDTDDDRRLGSLGAAFKGPRFTISYGYQGNPENSGDYRHSVDLEFPF